MQSKFANIFEAAKSGSVEDVKYFIEELGFGVNMKNERNETPLHIATGYNSLEVLQYLVSQGADVNAKSNDCASTPLHSAAFRNSSIEVLQYLISQGADVNATDHWNQTPLYFAAIALHDSVDILQYLLSQGADVNSVYVLCGDNEEGKRRIMREAGWRTGKTSEPQS